MLNYQQIQKKLLTEVESRKKMYVNYLKNNDSVPEKEDLFFVNRILLLTEILGNYFYSVTNHELSQTSPDPADQTE